MIRAAALLLLPAAAIAADRVTLQWTDNSDNETRFELYGRTPTGAWQLVAVTPANVTTADVDPATHDAWQVFAVNQWGRSGGSNELAKELPTASSNLRIVERTTTTQATTTSTTTTTEKFE